MKRYLLFIFLGGLLYFSSNPATAEDTFLSSTFNGHPIFIPKEYNQGSVLKPDINIEFVQVGAIYPTFSPADRPRKELVAEKEIQNYIHLYINPTKERGFTFLEFAEKTLKYSTQTFAETKYGLDKTAEPYKDFQQQSDRWIERVDGKPVSYISCTTAVFQAKGATELQVESKDYPCSHNFFSNDTWYVVKFHNSLLPHWKEIQNKSVELFESFRSRESAQNYLKLHK